MEHKDAFEDRFFVGAWLVEPRANRITGPAGTVSVQSKVMQVLLCLAQHAGETVTRDELMAAVWEDGLVMDYGLNQAISRLRKAFNDSASSARIIETIPKKGYRLVAPIRLHAPPYPQPGFSVTPNRPDAAPLRRAHPTRMRLRWMLIPLIALPGLIYLFATARTPAPLWKAQPLTSTPGIEFHPAFSPDGQQLAFVWIDEAWNADIYIKLLDDQPPHRITESPLFEYDPAWSPDGNHLAYYAFDPVNRADCTLYMKSILGGHPRKIAPCNRVTQQKLAWSPDGQWLAYQHTDTLTGDRRIELLSLQTLERHPATTPATGFTRDANPVFSPDGKTLLFMRRQHRSWTSDLYLVPVSYKPEQPRPLLQNRGAVMGHDWTPDGSHVVFLAGRQDNPSGLWRMPIQGGEPTLLHIVATDPGALSIARQGNRMVYEEWRFETNIWRVSGPQAATSTDTLHPLIQSTRFDLYPHYAPSGERVAFVSSRAGFTEIWISEASGDNQTMITSLRTDATSMPRWSPDGQRIAFQTHHEGHSDLFLVDPQDRRLRRLTTSSSEDIVPSWSQDGRFIYFASDRSGTFQIWKVPAEGGAAVQITKHGGYAAFEAPDSQSLFFSKQGQPGIWQLSFATGAVSQLTDALHPLDWSGWSVTDNGLYFLERKRPMIALVRRLDLHTHETTTITSVRNNVEPGYEGTGLTISPDERWILFGKVDQRSSDIMLLENF